MHQTQQQRQTRVPFALFILGGGTRTQMTYADASLAGYYNYNYCTYEIDYFQLIEQIFLKYSHFFAFFQL